MANLKSLVLPTFALGVYLAGPLARFIRSSLIETLQAQFVTTARAKGLSERRVMRGHALKNALIPTVTFAGLQIGGLLSGAIVTEVVFSLPGIGSLALNGVLNRDFPVVQGVVLVVACGYVLINIGVDLVYVVLDPRISPGGAPVVTMDAEAAVGNPWEAASRIRADRRLSRFARTMIAIFRRQPLATVVVALVLGCGLLAPVLAPHDPALPHMPDRLQGPSRTYFLGTDEFGRDLLSRLLFGARIALGAGAIAVGIATVGGVLLGLIAGYFGGTLDYALSRLIEAMQAFPVVLLAIAMSAMLGPSLRNAMVAIGIATIPDFARITRGVVLPTKEQQFVEASRVMGAGHARTLWRAILPELPAGADGARLLQHRQRDPLRVGAEFSRARRAAAAALVGHHALQRQELHVRRPLVHLRRRRDPLGHHHLPQSRWRRGPGNDRPASRQADMNP